MVHFDEAEIQEIGLGDPDYPELLRTIRIVCDRKPRYSARTRGYRYTTSQGENRRDNTRWEYRRIERRTRYRSRRITLYPKGD